METTSFQLHQVRKELVIDPVEREFSSQILKGSNTLSRTEPIKHSFVSWTKGEEDEYEEYDPNEDPFADCAGPTLQQLNAMRRVNPFPVSSVTPYSVDPACQVNRCRLYPVNKRTRAPNRKHLDKGKVYHAPASLPTLNPALANVKVADAYEKWLFDRQNRHPERMWDIKGNNDRLNYSTIGSSKGSLVQGSHELGGQDSHLDSTVITPMPELLHVEIHTSNQLLRARSVLEHAAHYSYKILYSDSSLQQLKHDIVQDIVQSIQHAFADPPADMQKNIAAQPEAQLQHAASSSSVFSGYSMDQGSELRSFDSLGHLNSSQSVGNLSIANNSVFSTNTKISVSMNQIDLVLQYYDWAKEAWRPLAEEKDWVQAKHLVAQFTPVVTQNSVDSLGQQQIATLQIMYALEPRSEHQLLKEIETFYEMKKTLLARSKEHISIQALTDALNNTPTKRQQALQPQQQQQQQQASLAKSSLASSVSSRPPTGDASKPLVTAKASLLYPKANPKLKALLEHSQNTEAKFQQIAKNLEKQILKTKW
eukprot:gene29581-35710_t